MDQQNNGNNILTQQSPDLVSFTNLLPPNYHHNGNNNININQQYQQLSDSVNYASSLHQQVQQHHPNLQQYHQHFLAGQESRQIYQNLNYGHSIQQQNQDMTNFASANNANSGMTVVDNNRKLKREFKISHYFYINIVVLSVFSVKIFYINVHKLLIITKNFLIYKIIV